MHTFFRQIVDALRPRAADDMPPYISTEERRALIGVGVVFTLIGLITMIMRLLTITIRHRSLGKDDWAMFVAWIFSIGFAGSAFVSVGWGVGYDAVPIPWEVNAIKALYAVEIFYYFSIFFIKISILSLYLRVAADVDSILQKGTFVIGIIVIAQFISTLVVVGVQCVPMEKYWDPTVPGSCVNIEGFFYSTNIFTIITDCAMLALPVQTLWRLNIPRPLKIGVLAAFLMGGLSTISSIIRLYSIRIYTVSHTPLRDAAPITTWSFIEINVAILSTSVVAIKPLFMPVKRNGRSQYYHDSKESDHSRREKRARTQASELTELETMNEGVTVGQVNRKTEAASNPYRSPRVTTQSQPSTSGTGDASRKEMSEFAESQLSPEAAHYEAWADRHIRREGSMESLGSQQILVKKAYTVRTSSESNMV